MNWLKGPAQAHGQIGLFGRPWPAVDGRGLAGWGDRGAYGNAEVE